jgi:hypothetical protein
VSDDWPSKDVLEFPHMGYGGRKDKEKGAKRLFKTFKQVIQSLSGKHEAVSSTPPIEKN